MASKRIDELDARVVADADLLPVTPSGGPSGKATVAAVVAEGLSQPNSASAGAGASITLKAADGVTSGAGGNITITPGSQAVTGGPGKVVIDTLTVGRGKSGVSTNTAVGVSALAAVTTGGNNTAIGNLAGALITTASNNTYVGSLAGRNVTSSNNTLIGCNAGVNLTTGDSNTSVGRASLEQCTTGYAHTIVGTSAGNSISTSINNTIIGFQAGYSIGEGSNNVCLGRSAGTFIVGNDPLSTPSDSVYIGYLTKGLTSTESNCIVIGASAIGEGSNTVVIGTSATVQQHLYATLYVKTEGSLVFAPSTPDAITTNQNDYVLTGSGFQRLNCTTASDITGIAPPTGGAHVDGRMIRLVNVGTHTVRLMHNSTSSAAANRMFKHTSSNVSLTVNEWADLVYDSTDNGSGAAGWRVVTYA